jgi:hypothetical protein
MENNNISIYRQKLIYYQRKLQKSQNNQLYLHKLNKYKIKYFSLGGAKKDGVFTSLIEESREKDIERMAKEGYNPTPIEENIPHNKLEKKTCMLHYCKINYDKKRNPSNCDRILYKGNIKPEIYNVYNDAGLVRLSDHLMVYGTFISNNKTGIIFTWNMAHLHNEYDINCGINKLFNSFTLEMYDYIVFCLQESYPKDTFTKNIINKVHNDLNKRKKDKFKVCVKSANSLIKGFNVRLIVFSKTTGENIEKIIILESGTKLSLTDKTYDYNNIIPIGVDSHVLNIEPRLIQSVGNTKSLVSIDIDGITFISCHFPLDTHDKTQDNYLGLELRIKALNKIKETFNSKPNIILAGDLNFRKILDSQTNTIQDQLSLTLLKEDFNKFKEFGTLTEPTCKLKECGI